MLRKSVKEVGAVKKIISVIGPTASGKSALALSLCRELNGELVSCDSMQIYKYMDIGTAKPTRKEMNEIPHHMVDFLDPIQNFSAADYGKLAHVCTEDILSRGKLPVVCGGTGLYLDALMNKTEYIAAKTDEALREKLLKKDKHELWCELNEVDPLSAENIHENNVKRVVRALEIYYTTGKTKTEIDTEQRANASENDDFFNIILDFHRREVLYKRINDRCDKMIEQGLIEEIRELLITGKLVKGTTAYQAIGYKELLEYINGDCSLEQSLDSLKQATRNYAKRQLTWFRRVNGTRIYVDDFSDIEDLNEYVLELVRGVTG